MKTYIWKCLVAISLLVLLKPTDLVHAQSGCPAYPNASILLEEDTLEIYPLVTALPEAQPPLAQGVFIEQVFELTYGVGQRVWLTSYVEDSRLGDICTDDLVEVAVSPSGKTWRHDFRSPDRQKILVSNAVNLTHLFVPGVNTITLTLTDLTGPSVSTSGYAIVVAGTTITPIPIDLPPTATVLPSAITRQPVATPIQPLPTAIITPTPSITLAVVSQLPATAEMQQVVDQPPTEQIGLTGIPGWQLALGIGLIGVSLGLAIFLLRFRQKVLPGTIDLFKGKQFQKTIVLAQFGKDVVRFGRKGDVVLSGEGMADEAARMYAQHLTVVLEILDPQNPTRIQERYILNHGESHWIGGYRLQYKNFQHTQSYHSGGFSHVVPNTNK